MFFAFPGIAPTVEQITTDALTTTEALTTTHAPMSSTPSTTRIQSSEILLLLILMNLILLLI